MSQTTHFIAVVSVVLWAVASAARAEDKTTKSSSVAPVIFHGKIPAPLKPVVQTVADAINQSDLPALARVAKPNEITKTPTEAGKSLREFWDWNGTKRPMRFHAWFDAKRKEVLFSTTESKEVFCLLSEQNGAWLVTSCVYPDAG